jgi:chromate transporter
MKLGYGCMNICRVMQRKRMNIYLDLFLTFARIGGLTFGGGYAMLPMLLKETVEKRGWVKEADLMDYYAISQCLPGIIAVNTALFVGNQVKKSRGGIAAALGVVFPSLVVITVIAAFIQSFSDMPLVQNAFAGIRVCVFVLIVNAIFKLGKKSIVDLMTAVMFLLVFILSVATDINPIILIVSAGVAGVVIQSAKAVK